MKDKINWKKGDWVFHNFRLKQVTSVDMDNNVGSATDGFYNQYITVQDGINVFPLDISGKLISERFCEEYLRFGHINVPLYDWLVGMWRTAMQCRDNADMTQSTYKIIHEFVDYQLKLK